MIKNMSDIKRRYDIARHHAWAGTVLLSVLLAIRIFLEISNVIEISDFIILAIGMIIVGYILVSLLFTYKYRSCLLTKDNQIYIHNIEEKIDSKTKSKTEKDKIKLEKKKTKAELKIQKKASKKN